MIENRSVPPRTVLPHVAYPSVEEAIEWLTRTFGFCEHYRYGEPRQASGAQMHLGGAWIMLRRSREGERSPKELAGATQSLTIFIEDVDGHYARTKAAGGNIVEELNETFYGEWQYGVVDFAGHHWLFARHAKDVSPDAWGATLAHATTRLAQLPRARLCYLEIPAADVRASAAFYEKVFGWRIRNRESDRPTFDDASGDVSGAWVTGREIPRAPGLVPYIWVDDIRAVFARCVENDAAAVEAPRPESPGNPCWIATFRDPAGNLIGLYEEGVKA
jgi:predicted enzyme related to lactoylglutathione lyase/uncharacterized glyoxalase superfamily protein PhnB